MGIVLLLLGHALTLHCWWLGLWRILQVAKSVSIDLVQHLDHKRGVRMQVFGSDRFHCERYDPMHPVVFACHNKSLDVCSSIRRDMKEPHDTQ